MSKHEALIHRCLKAALDGRPLKMQERSVHGYWYNLETDAATGMPVCNWLEYKEYRVAGQITLNLEFEPPLLVAPPEGTIVYAVAPPGQTFMVGYQPGMQPEIEAGSLFSSQEAAESFHKAWLNAIAEHRPSPPQPGPAPELPEVFAVIDPETKNE